MSWLNMLGLALAFLGLLSIPFLNENVDLYITHDYNESISPIFGKNLSTTDAKHYPGTAVKSLGPDKFYHKAETAFGTFEIEVTNKNNVLKVVQRLTNSDVLVEQIVENNDSVEMIWSLTTREYTIKTTQVYDKVTEEFSTASGSCVKQEYAGTVKEECTGQMSDLESRWSDAKDALEEWMKKMNTAAQEIELPNIQSSQWAY